MRRIWLAVGVLFVAGIVTVGRSAPPAAKRDALLAAIAHLTPPPPRERSKASPPFSRTMSRL